MTLALVVLAVIKIVILIGFFLNFGGLATWADRRQSAMVQHRIGPNRAVVYLPSIVARALLAGPALAIAPLAVLALSNAATEERAFENMAVAVQLAIFVVWFHLAVLSAWVQKKGPLHALEEAVASVEPRRFFYAGLIAHGAGYLLVRMAPPSVWTAGVRPAAVILACLICAVGFYAASRVPAGKVGLRALGTLHAAADAVKLIFKEDFIPRRADRVLHALAPMIALFPALVTIAVIPFGNQVCFTDNNKDGTFDFGELGSIVPALGRDGVCAGHGVPMQIVDLNVGILFVFAIASTGVVGAALAGWSSDNKYSLLGGLRAASQMVSYEVAMGLSLVGAFIVYGSVRLGPMVEWQSMFVWGIFVQPVAFILFLVCLAAENKRVPFDQPEGESEIVAGYFVEYSGMKFGMFMTGEYIEVMTSAALLVTIFFGGYSMPFLYNDGITIHLGDEILYQYKMNHLAVVVMQALAFFTKTLFVGFIQIFFRWTLPRFRYDQLMKLGWTKLLPVAIANLIITALVWLAIDSAPAGFGETLRVIGDILKMAVSIAIFAGIVAFISQILEPVKRRRFLDSTAARFAQAAGGVKPGPMQA